MNAPAASRYITLVVSNPERLQHGSAPRHRFDSAGGTIGCRSANWVLLDRQDQIQPVHCEICQEGGQFCVVDRSGKTHVNGSHAPIGKGVGVRINEGDTLQIGPYRLVAHMHDTDSPNGEWMSQGLDDFFPPAQFDPERGDLNGSAIANQRGYLGEETGASPLPTAPLERRDELDPLLALDLVDRAAAPQTNSPLDRTHYGLAPAWPQPDLGSTRFEAVSGAPKITTGESNMTYPSTDASQAQRWLSAQQMAGADPRQLVAPLLQGLGASTTSPDGQTAYRLLLESGQALHAAIIGLAKLYVVSPHGDDRLALMNRTLQPIEDNPLRLGLGYEETVQALFGSERSVVHLSPKAAMEESLEQVRRHQVAVIHAIGASLAVLLDSFSPDTLMQRFQRYRPEDVPETADWAWQMYTHYYNELASARQQGFEKLFWEIFEQAYDRALRAEAQ